MAAASPNVSTAPSESPVIQFTTIQNLFDAINGTTGDILTVHNVSVQQFAEIEKAREDRRRKFRFRRFSAATKILIIALPTRIHETLHACIWTDISLAIYDMGLRRAWLPTGATTFQAEQNPNEDIGEGDSTGCPSPARVKGWPTLVIEAGDSATLPELREDVRWWFSTSDHQVKIVLLVKINYSARSIILEKWVEVAAQIRSGAANTRAAAQLKPTCSQAITITQNPGNPASYNITGGALRAEFDLLFLRQPNPGEGDVILDVERLEAFAEKIWDQVD
ncbi:hypothetical protein BKA56DRAFT_585730 [Ilyonectria sp. MPI-CAGE-AT-0026]|nr:hypothetical protein BKA56DRAFT_585730 [Ilyonectria sp. MPI-CAGE-AT-0026]